MNTRSKVVELSGHTFQINRLPADAGSFIFMRLLGVSVRMQANEPERADKKESTETLEQARITGEMRVRAMTFSVFSGGIAFDEYRFIQRACMESTYIVQQRAGASFPLPIMADGRWTADGAAVESNVGLVMKLTTEVLVFCFSDFFDESAPGI